MSDVSKFTLDNVPIDVKDGTARTQASAAISQSSINAQDIADLKALSRLTVSYDSSTETIAFSTQSHT